MTQNHKMDDLSRVMTSNCVKVFVQRDFSDGTSIKFLTKFPPELDGKIESEQFVRTVTQLNNMFYEAESLGSRNYCESCLACLTAYMSYICFDTHYEKVISCTGISATESIFINFLFDLHISSTFFLRYGNQFAVITENGRHFIKMMLKKIKKFVEEQNQTIYLPRDLLLVDPVERGLRVLEICVLNESNGRG